MIKRVTVGRDVRAFARRMKARVPGRGKSLQEWWIAQPTDKAFLRMAYRMLLDREIDETGMRDRLEQLRDGATRASVLTSLRSSSEMMAFVTREPLPSLHHSRELFIRSLPPARRILDLGGTHLGDERGAMVVMASNIMCTCAPSVAMRAWSEPLCGTCTMSTPAMCLKSSPAM